MAENNNSEGLCFTPRHGIHATRAGATVDLVVCFECLQIYLYVNGSEIRNGGEVRFLTSKSPEAVFDKVLADANVPLARKNCPSD
jgi:hypothetical protein